MKILSINNIVKKHDALIYNFISLKNQYIIHLTNLSKFISLVYFKFTDW